MLHRISDQWIEHPSYDYLIIGATIGVVLAVNPHGLISVGDRSLFFQTLAAVSGGLLALGAISVTVVFTVTPTVRLQAVLDLVGQRLRWLIYSSLSGLVVTTAGALGLFALDGTTRIVRLAVTSGLLTLMGLRFGRLWWLFHLTLKTLVRRSGRDDVNSWTAPVISEGDYQLSKTAAHSVEPPADDPPGR